MIDNVYEIFINELEFFEKPSHFANQSIKSIGIRIE